MLRGMEVEYAPPRRIELGWAQLGSIGLHALFLLIAWWIPGAWRSTPPFEPEELVEVRFAPVPDFLVEGIEGGGLPRPASGGSRPSPRRPATAEASQTRSSAHTSGPPIAQSSPPEPLHRSEDPLPARRTVPSPSESAAAPSGEISPSRGFELDRALEDFRHALGSPGSRLAGEGDGGGGGSHGGLNVPDLPTLPNTGFGFGNLEFESRDYDWSDYAREIYMAIWRAWHSRLYLTTDSFERWGHATQTSLLDHQNRIQFTIEHNGQVTGVELETPSGCPALDDSATDALREVVLPPLPADFPRSRETIHARFIAHGEILGLRPTLRYLRSHGYF